MDESEKPGILCCKYWVLSILFAAFTMGSTLYMYAVYFSDRGIAAPAYVGPVALIPTIIVKFLVSIYDKRTKGKFFDRSKSNLLKPERGLKCKNLIPLCFSAYGNTAHFFFFALAFKYAKMAGLNQGVISILTIFATIFNVISFYFAFGEKPSRMKLFGMLFLIGTGVCLAVKAIQVGEENKQDLDNG